jgi:uncharacterized membrane protein (DUF2068 family)
LRGGDRSRNGFGPNLSRTFQQGSTLPFMDESGKPHESRAGLRLIAALKGVEALVLVLAGCGVLGLLNSDLDEAVKSWLDDLSLREGRRLIARAAAHGFALLDAATPMRLAMIGGASFVYAAVFIAEGVGLWLGKRWAEWVTIFTTASFLPFEAIEIFRSPSAMAIATFVINAAVVVYLVVNLIRKRDRHEAPQPA